MEASAVFGCPCGRRSRLESPHAAMLARASAACACGAPLAAPCAYVDLERGHAVRVEPPSSVASWRALEQTCAEELGRILAHGSPHLDARGRDLRLRLAFSLDELREKLVVWSHQLDDAVVETVKIRAYTSHPSLSGTRILVDSVGADDTLTCRWPDGVVELPGTWVRDAHRRRDSLSRRFPELFAGTFVNATRYFTA
ncbi:MAG: hypothetical protein KIT31_18675 [Deltaproteobacteria bacterium]|nr:hypothetical protein [Deltaproteobacteria bacterium]